MSEYWQKPLVTFKKSRLQYFVILQADLIK